MEKRWNILGSDSNKVLALHKALFISESLCSTLVQREIDTFLKAKTFFRPQLSDLHDPWLMKDMNKAVDRILTAFKNHEKILVFGDYDVDGTTSVALVYRFLVKVYKTELINFYIPDRYKEGYGISKLGIDFARTNDFSLIIALDCGIKSFDLITYAKTLNIDFIICDHHLPGSELPPAVAILNPKQQDCNYPYKELCGCGIGFKLITALSDTLKLEDLPYLSYLDLVATAIAADIVPITGENRVLAWYGLNKINKDPNPGIKALIKLSGIIKEFTITNVVFVIAPRINAAGRMDDARKAVRLFIEDNFEKALQLAEILQTHNNDRKLEDTRITEEALEMLNSDDILQQKKSTVVFQPHWHKGVVGIVASRLIEKYYRPTVVLTQHQNVVSGSARSVNGFNLYEAVHACREHLLAYGGHFAAAGLSLLPGSLQAFSNSFELAVATSILPHQTLPEITIDAEIEFKGISKSLNNIIKQMEPFGPGNLLPVFITRKVSESGYSKIVKSLHVKFVLKKDNIFLSGIGFNLAEKFHLLQPGNELDVVFTIDENEWKGETTLQLKILDIRLSQL